MPLTTTTDHAAIRALVEPLLAADPVRHTVLGTMLLMLEGSAWAATDGDRLAVRSGALYPVLLVGTWTEERRGELHGLLAALDDLTALSGAEDQVWPLAELLGVDPTVERQRLYRLDRLTEPAVDGYAVVAGPEHRAFARACVAAFAAEARDDIPRTDAVADTSLDGGLLHLWLDPAGEPTAIACRRPVISGSARIGPVYTPPEQRGRGYGSGVTASATRSILDDGAIPVLFTDLDNPTSNKIYQTLGYHPVEDRVYVARRGPIP
ncbi:GNAT family N-acetyltransferase [uncultured Jatrophihabitans sp.]|uniref:GNAT family N-acetyltransferase n=1 Tax=uncultured Jatrophihabitans sp. TaxID=1610747 RepID=UPI0035CB8FA1